LRSTSYCHPFSYSKALFGRTLATILSFSPPQSFTCNREVIAETLFSSSGLLPQAHVNSLAKCLVLPPPGFPFFFSEIWPLNLFALSFLGRSAARFWTSTDDASAAFTFFSLKIDVFFAAFGSWSVYVLVSPPSPLRSAAAFPSSVQGYGISVSQGIQTPSLVQTFSIKTPWSSNSVTLFEQASSLSPEV